MYQHHKEVVNRHGAEAAREAHNFEVIRSKRIAGIFPFGRFTEPTRQLLSDVKLAI